MFEFNNLPIEIRYLILEYLSLENSLNYRLVCMNWKMFFQKFTLIYSTKCARKINYIYPNIHTLILYSEPNYLENFQNLKKIIIKDYIPEEIDNLNLKSLVLDLKHSSLSKSCLQRLLIKINEMPKLTSFSLVGKKDYCQFCASSFGQLNNLIKLNFTNYQYLGKNILENILRLKKLKKLVLINPTFTFNFSLLEIFKNEKILEKLTISRNIFPEIEIHQMEILYRLKKLIWV